VDPSVATSPDPGSAPPITTAGGDVPEAVAAESHSSTAIHIEWREVATATAYSIKRTDDPPDLSTSWAFIAKTRGDVTDYTDQGLEPATTYWYRVSAITTSGAAVASDIVSATTSVAPPEAPSVMAIATSTTVDLSWADGASETAYRIERSTDDSIGWTVIGTTGMDVTAYTDSALLPETTYLYRVVATNAGGDSPPSAVVSVTTLEEKNDGGTVPDPTPGSDNGGGAGPKDGAGAIEDGPAAIVGDGAVAIEGGVASAEAKAQASLATIEDAVATVDLSSAAVPTG
jgi:titin